MRFFTEGRRIDTAEQRQQHKQHNSRNRTAYRQSEVTCSTLVELNNSTQQDAIIVLQVISSTTRLELSDISMQLGSSTEETAQIESRANRELNCEKDQSEL